MEIFTMFFKKMSIDIFIYFIMILMGVLTWYIAHTNESSKLGKKLITVGLALFLILFLTLIILRFLTVI